MCISSLFKIVSSSRLVILLLFISVPIAAAQNTAPKHSAGFNGIDEHIQINNGVNLVNDFTVSAWILSSGSNNANNSRTILAKGDRSLGFSLHLNGNNKVVTRWNNGTSQVLTSRTTLSDNVWRHIAITYNGSTVSIYIDGVLDSSRSRTAPVANNYNFIIGARKNLNGNVVTPFNGEIDELRIWNTVLSINQIRYMMNQEIENSSSIVNGKIIPETIANNDAATLDWSNLIAYYDMNVPTGTSIQDRSINANHANTISYSALDQSAPLPYITASNNDWENPAAWINGAKLFTPGSSRNINGTTTMINWNIVRTNHDIAINNYSTTLLGLEVNSNQIDVNNSHGLTITHYLKLDGKIDLKEESQLIQTTGSELDTLSTGSIERDQQGTSNRYNYNYWSSPVSRVTNSNNDGYSLDEVLRDGTDASNPQMLNWTGTGTRNGAPASGTTAATISGRWLYAYGNLPSGQYSNWQYVGPHGDLQAGEAWTMKGTGASTTKQNYVFEGKPNNGDIDLPINAGNDYLIGNPYPSALDMHEFILANPHLDGTVYFWEHWGGNSHFLSDYQGGYGLYNFSGGVGNPTFGTANPAVNSGGLATKVPKRFAPVAQGFFVIGKIDGTIKFRNNQRQFVTEASTNSIFVAAPGSNANANAYSNLNTTADNRLKIRIGFDSPNAIHRQLLLTVDANTTTGFDRGYDGVQYNEQIDDISFTAAGKELTIQGIPAINDTVELPLRVKIADRGTISILLDDVENLPSGQNIYLRDNQLNTYTNILNTTYTSAPLWPGVYEDRFSIVFSTPSTLSNDDTTLAGNDIILYTPQGSQSLMIKKPSDLAISQVNLINMMGQQVSNHNTAALSGTLNISTTSLSSGNYIVSMTTPAGIISKKIIIK